MILGTPIFRPVHGLIFLFKWQGRDPASATNQAPIEYENPDVFFAQQVQTTRDMFGFLAFTICRQSTKMSDLIIYVAKVLNHLLVYLVRIGDHECVCDTGDFVDSSELEDD